MNKEKKKRNIILQYDAEVGGIIIKKKEKKNQNTMPMSGVYYRKVLRPLSSLNSEKFGEFLLFVGDFRL